LGEEAIKKAFSIALALSSASLSLSFAVAEETRLQNSPIFKQKLTTF